MPYTPPVTYVYADSELSQVVADIVSRNTSKFVSLSKDSLNKPADEHVEDSRAVVVLRPEPSEDFAKVLAHIFDQIPENSHVILISANKHHEKLISTFSCFSRSTLCTSVSAEEVEKAILAALRSCDRNHAPEPENGEAIAKVKSNCENLSFAELDVLCHILEGALNKTIAGRLDVSERTIENRRRKIFDTFGTHSIAVLTRMISETIGCEAVFQMRDKLRNSNENHS